MPFHMYRLLTTSPRLCRADNFLVVDRRIDNTAAVADANTGRGLIAHSHFPLTVPWLLIAVFLLLVSR